MISRRTSPLPLAVTLLLAASQMAVAGSDKSTLTVKVAVQERCTLSTGTLDFGTYSSGQTTDLLAQGTINVASCPVGSFTFELDGGSTGKETGRKLAKGSEKLSYKLFSDSQRSKNWGSADSAKKVTFSKSGASTVPVYGSIPGKQEVSAGTYSDTVQVTVNF